MAEHDDITRRLYATHSRVWSGFTCVYSVISRRSGGLSVGVNLNLNQACNFDCVYCCVHRHTRPGKLVQGLGETSGASDSRQKASRAGASGGGRVGPTIDQLHEELDRILSMVSTGEIWQDPSLVDTPAHLRVLRDIAFSGDGEPTTHPQFDEAVRVTADLKRSHGFGGVKLVLITNATMLQKPTVQRGLEVLDANHGEVWAKLDAGTELYYKHIDRSNIPLDRILRNIAACGRQRPIVIQSLFMKTHGEPVSDAEFDAYLGRLESLLNEGCRISAVQLVTVARRPAESFVEALSDAQMDALAARLRDRLPSLPVQVAYGVR